MRVNAVCLDLDKAHELQVRPDMEVMNVKVLLEAEWGIPQESMVLKYEDTELSSGEKCLGDYGVGDDDLLTVTVVSAASTTGSAPAVPNPAPASSFTLPNFDWSSVNVGPARPSPPAQAAPSHQAMPADPEDPLVLREKLLNDPVQAQMLSENNPALYQSLISGDPQKFVAEMERQRQAMAEHNMQRIRLLAADQFDEDAQRQIAENIRMEEVETNMRTAMEHHPESFGQVVMLYVNCKLNGHPVKAFVDSGAQMTIISQSCAEKCNIFRLVDQRFQGIAQGVGTQKILGRIHLAQLQIENDYLSTSFSVLEDQKMDLLIGLDMLKRHQCCVDLRKNVLRIGTTGTETPFLPENDVPKHAKLSGQPMSPAPPSEGGQPSAEEIADRELAQALEASARGQPMDEEPGAKRSPPPTASASTQSAPTPMSTSTPAAATASGGNSDIPEESIQRLVTMGYSRVDVVEALRNANGNVDMALIGLFSKALAPGR